MSDEDAPKPIKVDYYIDLVLRRKWLLIISFCLAMIGGIFLSVTTPRIYVSDTLIFVEPKSIPDKYVAPITEVDVKQRVSTITQQVKSRTYIEQVIKDAGLFATPEYRNMLLEEKVASVRKNMKVEVTRGRKGTDSFKISFTGTDPEKIAKTVNVLAGIFIDESVRVMEAEVLGARDFLAAEVGAMADKLVNVETSLREYRKIHMGGLPEQLGSNLSMLDGFHKQLEAKQESLRDEKRRAMQFQGQRTEIQREMDNYTPDIISDEVVASLPKESENVLNLRKLKEQHASLSAKYTALHPDVIKLKNMIAEFEMKTEDEKKQADTAPQAEKPKKKNRAEVMIEKYRDIKEERIKDISRLLEESKTTIKIYEEDIVKLNEQINAYEKRVEDTPEREQEIMSLKRNYENIRDSYESMLDKKLDADIAVSMERKAKGNRFRVVDKAKVPKKPVSPDIKKLLLMSVAAGLGIGGGLIFLLDILDTSLRRPEDIETLLEIPVLATVPNIYYRSSDRIKQKLDLILSLIFIMIGLGLMGAFVILSMKGLDGTEELAKKILRKLGLLG